MKLFSLSAATLLTVLLGAVPSLARDQIQIAGSSTVLPYAKIVAETFGEIYPNYKTPVVESGGSSAGLKEFCRGVGPRTIDIANASRPIRGGEIENCVENGVSGIFEIPFGYDGIVFATDASMPEIDLTPLELYKALAAELVMDGVVVANPYRRWSEVDPSLPDVEITAYIPGEKHGTREVFEEKVLKVGCEAAGAAEFLVSNFGKVEGGQKCIAVRKDGRAPAIDGDYSETLARVIASRTGIGVFGLSFYENNADKLNVATISDVVPSAETVASGEYPVSRPLYFYVKKPHVGVIAGLKEYVDFFLSDDMAGPDGPLAEYGLVPSSSAERAKIRADFDAGVTMTQ
ncbi:PstS family phosphate ABC transporter substrate-binding protein [Martelella endophytica]|uniref:Phosphonate ABC transporter substrate-binding protein n=1 Tax=Martelella endophytica TaxID=1486262 RepID=A0A0D5LM91_MAREN|nr:substrate-binding domain-containing protein [Martelella endophytica]AJY45334.1 phosphonate ABC transporter substrate-binding protein [Martelella endophytica]